jgi:hypothetical protein
MQSFSNRTASHLGIYAIKGKSAIEVKNQQLWYFNGNCNQNEFDRLVQPNCLHYNYPLRSEQKFNCILIGQTCIFISRSSEDIDLIRRLQPQILVMSNNSLPDFHLESLCKFVKIILADASNSLKEVNRVKLQCSKFGIDFFSTTEFGYLCYDLKKKNLQVFKKPEKEKQEKQGI